MEQIDIFHRKSLRSFLSLSDRSPVPALFFLFGELPLSAKIHRDVFSLFYGIMSNPKTTVYKIVRYLLEEAPNNSRTWSIYVRNLAKQYGLADPLDMMNQELMSKENFKEMVTTKISAYHEEQQRNRATNNSKMVFLNVSVTGLRGKHHPVLSDVITTADVKAVRPVLKCLTSDYYTYSVRAAHTGGSDHCRICVSKDDDGNRPTEDIVHVIAGCDATSDIRQKMLEDVIVAAGNTKVPIDITSILSNQITLTQFLLDNTSLNLDNSQRVNISDIASLQIFKQSRKLISAIHAERLRKLKQLEKKYQS